MPKDPVKLDIFNTPAEPEKKAPVKLDIFGAGKTEKTREIGGVEYQARSLGNTLMGSAAMALDAVNFTPQKIGEIAGEYAAGKVAGEGKGYLPVVMENVASNWREAKQSNQMLLDTYDPNAAEEVLAFALGVTADLPIFGGFGKLGHGAVKLGQIGVK
ncbi:unnamed protein product, partial [marine sediment metagenome]